MDLAVLDVIRPAEEETPGGAARVFTFFRDKLLSGELKAGDRLLAERELALALGVSRPVLREALRSLAMLGLWTSGTAVAPSCARPTPRCSGRR